MSSALERFESRLLRYAQRIVGDSEEARDVVQDTFLKLCRQNPEELNGRLAQWLYTVCRNQALDVRRRQGRRAAAAPDDVANSGGFSREPPPPETAARSDSVAQIHHELDRLTPDQQECIRLKFQHELSYQEISAVTGLSVSNVGFLIHTGLKCVRERLARRAARESFPEGVSPAVIHRTLP